MCRSLAVRLDACLPLDEKENNGGADRQNIRCSSRGENRLVLVCFFFLSSAWQTQVRRSNAKRNRIRASKEARDNVLQPREACRYLITHFGWLWIPAWVMKYLQFSLQQPQQGERWIESFFFLFCFVSALNDVWPRSLSKYSLFNTAQMNT